MWREARGSVLRKEYEDVAARMAGANAPARSSFLNNIHQTIDEAVTAYSSGSASERKALFEECRKAMTKFGLAVTGPQHSGLACPSSTRKVATCLVRMRPTLSVRLTA
jgi:hypothetical protein